LATSRTDSPYDSARAPIVLIVNPYPPVSRGSATESSCASRRAEVVVRQTEENCATWPLKRS
jgi:hypothetical protein